MIKNIISPIQMWLLNQNRCVGCGMLLSKGKINKLKNKDSTICKCGRIYIKEKNTYRRAKLNEI